jgi:hypothetical protein
MRSQKAIEELDDRLDGYSVVRDTGSEDPHFARVTVSRRSVDLRLSDSMLEAAEQIAAEREMDAYDALQELTEAAVDAYD